MPARLICWRPLCIPVGATAKVRGGCTRGHQDVPGSWRQVSNPKTTLAQTTLGRAIDLDNWVSARHHSPCRKCGLSSNMVALIISGCAWHQVSDGAQLLSPADVTTLNALVNTLSELCEH